MSGLRHGVLGPDARILCIDMQRLFLEPGPWHCADATAILPAVGALCAIDPARTLFTRFIPAHSPQNATGTWQRYYRRYEAVTLAKLDEGALDLPPSLAAHAIAQNVFDKTTYDAFQAAPFARQLAQTGPATLIVCGVETDVCVLATVLSAVDLGHRVILAEDALASGEASCHEAALAILGARFDLQVEIAATAEILAALAQNAKAAAQVEGTGRHAGPPRSAP